MKLAITILLLFPFLHSKGGTLEVGKGKSYNTIQSAIAAANNGDEILVYPGIYAEGEIMIDKYLSLKGIGYPVIEGKKQYQLVRITADNVSLTGFELRNSGYSSSYDWAAIKVVNSNNVLLKNNRLYNNTFGIYLQQTSGCMIVNNLIKASNNNETESGNAIHCWKSDNIKILNNEVTGHRDGIYFEFVTKSLIQNNNSYKNIRYGLHFMFSHSDSYIQNIFRNNGSGVAVMFSNHVIMKYNLFEENWGSAAYGIFMKEISDGVIAHNRFIRNTMGVYLEGTNRIQVTKNLFSYNGWAMRVQASSADNNITDNNFMGNTFDVGTNGTNQLNTFLNNYWDKYEGYDLNKDGIGDVHFMPVSLYSMIIEKMPVASILLRSFMITVMDKVERIIPSITPIALKDDKPLMKPVVL